MSKLISRKERNSWYVPGKTNEYYDRLSRENHAKEIVAETIDNAIYSFSSKRNNKNNDT